MAFLQSGVMTLSQCFLRVSSTQVVEAFRIWKWIGKGKLHASLLRMLLVCNLVAVEQILQILVSDRHFLISQSIFLLYFADASNVVERQRVEFQGHVVTTRRPVFSEAALESLNVGVNSFKSSWN